jgi:hypothetical protein
LNPEHCDWDIPIQVIGLGDLVNGKYEPLGEPMLAEDFQDLRSKRLDQGFMVRLDE